MTTRADVERWRAESQAWIDFWVGDFTEPPPLEGDDDERIVAMADMLERAAEAIAWDRAENGDPPDCLCPLCVWWREWRGAWPRVN